VGVSVAESLHPAVRLKWPNDLWVDDRKLGGILIETASFGEGAAGARYAVIGIGLNIAPRAASGLSTPPAAVRELLPDADAAAVLLRLAPALVRDVQAFELAGFPAFHARFDARDTLRDRPVVLSDGTAGTAHGVAGAGALLVHTAAGLQAVGSSEVSVRPAAA
jgi:BirA family biotin operon repressor/biotin-[acetyl-CoA-carboxylase] ligase